MAGERLIYSLEEFDKYTDNQTQRIRRAAVAAAFKMRDNVRERLVVDSKTVYKYHTGDMRNQIHAIQIGKEVNGTIKIHALGTKRVYDSYKGRFFVGGTILREDKKVKGKPLAKPRPKGYIKPLNLLDKELPRTEQILKRYINNVIK